MKQKELHDLLIAFEKEPFGKFLLKLEKSSKTMHIQVLEAVGTVEDDMVLTKEQKKAVKKILKEKLKKVKKKKKKPKKLTYWQKLKKFFC